MMIISLMLQMSSESLPEERSVTEAAAVTRPIRCRRCQQVLPDQRPLSTKSVPTEESTAVEVEVDEQKELDSKSVQTEQSAALQVEVETKQTAAVEVKVDEQKQLDCKSVQTEQSADLEVEVETKQTAAVEVKVDEQKQLDCKSVQTEQSAAFEVEIAEQKELNRQLVIREEQMKNYIEMLRDEVERRSSEAVAIAARLRGLEPSPLSEICPPQTSQQPDDEPAYKSKHFCVHMYLCMYVYCQLVICINVEQELISS